MEQETLGSILVIWLLLMAFFNGSLAISMARKPDDEGATFAVGTAIFFFFGSAISAVWIWRAIP
jgi:hypothetical protein